MAPRWTNPRKAVGPRRYRVAALRDRSMVRRRLRLRGSLRRTNVTGVDLPVSSGSTPRVRPMAIRSMASCWSSLVVGVGSRSAIWFLLWWQEQWHAPFLQEGSHPLQGNPQVSGVVRVASLPVRHVAVRLLDEGLQRQAGHQVEARARRVQ